MRYTRYLAATLALAAHCSARPDGVGGHHGDHGGHHVEHGAAASAPAVSGPSGGYGAPEQSYDASSYEQPAYDAAAYSAPAGYDQAYDTADSAAGPAFDLSSLLVPILIIAGLALLFPSTMVVPVTGTGRRKREAGDSSSNLVERVQDIYLAVVESEECMERVACEVGGIAAEAGINKGMFKLAETYVPKKYQKMMKNFTASKDCHKIKCGAF